MKELWPLEYNKYIFYFMVKHCLPGYVAKLNSKCHHSYCKHHLLININNWDLKFSSRRLVDNYVCIYRSTYAPLPSTGVLILCWSLRENCLILISL